MLKRILLGLVTLMVVSCAPKTDYVITGTVAGYTDGTVYLKKLVDQGGVKLIDIDTAEVVDSKFQFTGVADSISYGQVVLNSKQLVSDLFIEGGEIVITANIDSLDGSTIQGTESNDLYSVYKSEISNLRADIKVLSEEFQKASSVGDEEKIKTIRIDYETMIENINVYTKNFITENITSAVSPVVTLISGVAQSADGSELNSYIENWDAFKGTVCYNEIKKVADIKSKTDKGAAAPEITMATPEGESLSLSSLKGQYVLIDFWASWCGPCRRANPGVVELFNKYSEKGFTVLGVSLDNKKEDWLKAIEDDKLTWPHVSDLKGWKNAAAVEYGIRSIPASVLVDKEGNIIGKNLTEEELDEKLSELLN